MLLKRAHWVFYWPKYALESCTGRVDPRGLRVPAFAGQVREPALLCVGVRGECGLNLLRHRRIQDFFRGELKDKFIRMCTDCIAVKTQLLR